MSNICSWIVCLIDTGMSRNDLIGSCCDESHTFYDHRVREQHPIITEEIVSETIDKLLDDGILKGDDYLKVNWTKWRSEIGKIPSISNM